MRMPFPADPETEPTQPKGTGHAGLYTVGDTDGAGSPSVWKRQSLDPALGVSRGDTILQGPRALLSCAPEGYCEYL